MKIIVAIDSFKGCLTSQQANLAAKVGIIDAVPEATVVCLPVSDGGEGWLEAWHCAFGGELRIVEVLDPLKRPIRAEYLKLGETAVIEVAKVIGLPLLKDGERNPLKTTSFGVGQLILAAAKDGCRKLMIGLGGSSTIDGGKGMMEALHEKINAAELSFTIAADVTNPLCGTDGAAFAFGTQKGATPEMMVEIDKRLSHIAAENAEKMGFDKSTCAGAGAAGGLGYAFMQFFDANICSGAELLLKNISFDEKLRGADFVVTGEGRADRQTLKGKLPYTILQHARRQNVPTLLLSGNVQSEDELLAAGFSQVRCIHPNYLPKEMQMLPHITQNNIRQTLREICR